MFRDLISIRLNIETDDNVQTSVQQLDNSGTIDELTKMLSGMNDSKSGQSHAKELLHHAREFNKLTRTVN